MIAFAKRLWSSSRMPSWVTVSISTGVLAAMGVGAAAAAGVFAAAPTAYAGVQADPVSSAMISAITTGRSIKLVPMTASAAEPSGTISLSAAEKVAVASLPIPGSHVLGASLMHVSSPRFGPDRLVWLVSLDPPGGLHAVGMAITENYCVAFVDAATGQWLMTTAGRSVSLPALPQVSG